MTNLSSQMTKSGEWFVWERPKKLEKVIQIARVFWIYREESISDDKEYLVTEKGGKG